MPDTADFAAQLEEAAKTIAALNAQRDELIAEKRKTQANAEEARKAVEAAEEEKARLTNDAAALEKTLTKRFAKEIDDLRAQLTDRDSRLTSLLIDDGLNQAMNAHNIAPQYRRAFTAMMKADAKIEAGVAMIGDQPMADHIKAFVGSDEGKAFVSASMNSGANAVGGKVTTGAPAKLTRTEYLALMASDPAAAKAYDERNKTA